MKKLLFTLMLLIAMLAGGCWDQRQISDLAVVLGAGIDVSGTGEVLLTVELAHITTKNSEGEPQLFSATGPTVAQAMRNLAQGLDRQLHWSHLQMLLIGERAARRGVEQYLSIFYNNKEMSPRIYFALCQGQAQQALAGRAGLSAYASLGLHDTLLKQRDKANGQISAVSLQRFMSEHALPHGGLAVPLVARRPAAERDELYFKGMAVLDEQGRYAGQLNGDENCGMALFLSRVQPYNLTLVEPNMRQKVTVELEYWRARPQWQFDPVTRQIKLTLECKAKGRLVDEQESTQYSDQAAIEHLEELFSAELKRQLQRAWWHARAMEVDFLGLGQNLYRHQAQRWDELLPSWPQALRDIELDVQIEAKVDVDGQSR